MKPVWEWPDLCCRGAIQYIKEFKRFAMRAGRRLRLGGGIALEGRFQAGLAHDGVRPLRI
jgi:hypothetical protein